MTIQANFLTTHTQFCVRLFSCLRYTNSETIFAKELAQYPPESYHLTTKIGRYQGREDPFDFSAQNTRE